MRIRVCAIFIGMLADLGVTFASGLAFLILYLAYEIQRAGFHVWFAEERLADPAPTFLYFAAAICGHLFGGFTSVKRDPEHRISTALLFGTVRLVFGSSFHVFHPQYWASGSHILGTLLIIPVCWFGGRQFAQGPSTEKAGKLAPPPIALP